ncbi:MAG: DUF1559 domain-containing protein, partial [Pirellulales bacterium]|nr:DUF1559 domain-containing protein [Pirellulales bacterium]
PAVQAAREAARRTTCINQLKQIGLGVQNHVSAFKVFPSGGIHPWPQIEDYSTGGKPFGAGKQGLSWAFQILPFLEQTTVHNLSTTAQLTGTPVEMYFCPSRRPPTINALDGFWLIDYVGLVPSQSRGQMGNARFNSLTTNRLGCNLAWGFWGVTNDSNIWPTAPGEMKSAENLGAAYQGFWGVLTRSSHLVKPGTKDVMDMGYPTVGMAQIEDGTSNTAMIGEKRLNPEFYMFPQWHDDRGWSDGWDPDTLRSTLCPPTADGSSFGNAVADGLTSGSAHPGGLQVAFADGSVHTIRYDIDLETYNRLAHRADGEIIDPSTL